MTITERNRSLKDLGNIAKHRRTLRAAMNSESDRLRDRVRELAGDGFGPTELAEATGLSRQTIHNWISEGDS